MTLYIIVAFIIILIFFASKNNKEVSPIDELKSLNFVNKKHVDSNTGQIKKFTQQDLAIVSFQEYIDKVEAGDCHASYMISNLYKTGNLDFIRKDNIFPKNSTKALWWLLKAANEGDISAQYELGVMYLYGRSYPQGIIREHMYDIDFPESLVERNPKEAIKWLIKCSEHPDLDNLLIVFRYINYFIGEAFFLEKKYTNAYEYFLLHIDATTKLKFNFDIYNSASRIIDMYLNGQGVDKDLIQAYKWCYIVDINPNTKGIKLSEIEIKKALALVFDFYKSYINKQIKNGSNYYNSALKLSDLYAYGIGVEKSLIEAYKWCYIVGADLYYKNSPDINISKNDDKKARELADEWNIINH